MDTSVVLRMHAKSHYCTRVYLKKNLFSSSGCGAISRLPVGYAT